MNADITTDKDEANASRAIKKKNRRQLYRILRGGWPGENFLFCIFEGNQPSRFVTAALEESSCFSFSSSG
jgi:hypothetical protein